MESMSRNLLENFEQNKVKFEEERYRKELMGEAGVTDFSPEALQRLKDVAVYEDALIEMAKRNADHPLDKFDQSKTRDEYELKINDPVVKTMKYYAEQINRLRRELRNEEQRLRDESVTLERHRLDRNSDSQSLTSQYLEQIKQAIKNKEDILQDKLIEYRQNPSAEESIINDIIDMTDLADPIDVTETDEIVPTDPDHIGDVSGDKDDSAGDMTFEAEFGKDFDEFARVAKEKLGFDLSEDDLEEIFEQYQNASNNANQQVVSGDANHQTKSEANQIPSAVAAETKNEASAADALKKDPNFLTKVGNFLKKKCLNKFRLIMVALLLGGAITAGVFVNQLRSPENLAALSAEKNPTEISLEQGGDDSNLNKTQESVDENDREEQSETEAKEDKEYSYENHKEGDPIHFDAKLDAENRDKLENKNHHLFKLEGETAQELFESLKQANYEAPYMIAQLAFFGHVQLVDKDDNVVPANDSNAVNELIKQMKNSPELFGKNYDIVNKLFQNAETRLTSTGEVFDLKNGYDTTHAYINRQTGELGIGLTQNWQEDDKVLEIKFLNEKKEQTIIRYKAKCGQLIILSTKVDTNTVLIVVQEKIVKVPVEKEVIKEVIKTVKVPVEKVIEKVIVKEVKVPVVEYRDRIVYKYINEDKPDEKEAKDVQQSPDANSDVNSPGKATGENLQSTGEVKAEQRSQYETFEDYMKQINEIMENNRQEEEKQARENYEAEMRRIAEENKQALNGAEGQADVVTSSDEQAAEAVKQKHEEAVKEAGEAEDGTNPQSGTNQEETDLP